MGTPGRRDREAPPLPGGASMSGASVRLVSCTRRACFPKPAWPALLPSLAARLRCPSCWCAPRTPCVPGVSARPVATAPAASAARPGLDAGATGALHCAALEGGRTTPQQLAALRSAARVVESHVPPGGGRHPGVSRADWPAGAAAHSPASKRPIDLPPGAQRAAKPPREGEGGWEEAVARAERSGAGAFLVRPLGGGRWGQGAASVRARCPQPRGARTVPGSPAVRGGSPAATRYQPLH